MATHLSSHALEEKKAQKEVSIARNTVECYLNSVLPKAGITYNISPMMNGVELRIRMTHGRMMRIRFSRHNYMRQLENIIPSILTIIEAFEKIGKTKATVIGLAPCVDWQVPPPSNQD